MTLSVYIICEYCSLYLLSHCRNNCEIIKPQLFTKWTNASYLRVWDNTQFGAGFAVCVSVCRMPDRGTCRAGGWTCDSAGVLQHIWHPNKSTEVNKLVNKSQ